MRSYPDTWPGPNPNRPNSLANKITEAQKIDLYNRHITTRDLAKALNVHENYLSSLFPGKIPLPNRKALREARVQYRLEIAKQILQGKYTVRQAADKCACSYNTMYRLLNKAKELHPHLLPTFRQIVEANRRKKHD